MCADGLKAALGRCARRYSPAQAGSGTSREGPFVLEVVALGALTTFLTAVGDGAGGEIARRVALSAGALTRRTLGGRRRSRPVPRA